MRVSILFVLAFAYTTQAANILLLSPLGSKSHKNFFMSVLKVLAEEGHQVTVVSNYRSSKPIANIRDVVLPTRSAASFVRDVFGDPNKGTVGLLTHAPRVCTDGLLTQEIGDLKKEKFDLIILSLFFSECYLSLVHHFKVPFVYILPAGLIGVFHSTTGNINLPSIVPNILLQSTFPLSFTDRLQSTVVELMVTGAYEFYTLNEMEQICRAEGVCPADMPPLREFFPNVSLTILNNVQSLEVPPRPSVLNTIHVGGLHCVAAKKLPKDLEAWFQGSGSDGVIYFSLGSAVTPSDLPEAYRKILVKVFGSLKQRVLWKWDKETMDDLPANVKLGKWLPQQDILGHAKTKMFISHGGLLSTMEATYHGCPVLGMPLFGDQYSNIQEAVLEGWAESLLWNDLSEDRFRAKIRTVLNDKSLLDNIKHRATLMNDQLVSPKKQVSYWVNYVLRYKGAAHIKSPIGSMPTYQLYNMDVWATIIAAIGIILYIIWALLKCCCRCFKSKSKTQKPNKSKKA